MPGRGGAGRRAGGSDPRRGAGTGGAGGLIALTGEAGVGKTRLLRELAVRAQARGLQVLAGRAVDTTAPFPYRALASALVPVLRDQNSRRGGPTGLLSRALGLLSPEPPRDAVPPPTADAPLLACEGTAGLLREIAGAGGLVMTIDDAQWADAESLGVVDYLVDTRSCERVLTLVAVRSDTPLAAGALLDRLQPASVIVLPRRLSRGSHHACSSGMTTAPWSVRSEAWQP